MTDWIAKLGDFLKISDRDILTQAGNVSHRDALANAHAEYEEYRQQRLNAPSPVESDLLSDHVAVSKTALRCPCPKILRGYVRKVVQEV